MGMLHIGLVLRRSRVRVGAQCNPFAEEKKRRSLLPRRTFSAVSPTRVAGGLSQGILVGQPPPAPRYLAMWPPYFFSGAAGISGERFMLPPGAEWLARCE
jgi:hypothetical protein